jgi:acyl carrier protein
MPLTRELLVDFVNQRAGSPVVDLDDDTALFSSNLIDSFTMVDLITLIERHCGIRVAATDVSLDNLDSIGRILRFVNSRVPAAS